MALNRSRIAGAALVLAGIFAAFGGLWMLWPPMAVVLIGITLTLLGVLLIVEVT